jgi:DNA-binding TFAR19-related protein (PDSD5 family)
MKNFLIIFVGLTLYACDFSKRIDTTAAVKEMRERQVKRVLPQDIVNQVDVLGKALQMNLSKGVSADTLRSKNKVLIQMGSVSQLKQSVTDTKIVEMLDAIDFGMANKQEIPASIQKNSTGDSLFYIYPTNKGNITLIGFSKKQVIIQMDKPLIK